MIVDEDADKTNRFLHYLILIAMDESNDNVPLFKTWNGWYLFVIVFLLVLILFFYWLTKYFA